MKMSDDERKKGMNVTFKETFSVPFLNTARSSSNTGNQNTPQFREGFGFNQLRGNQRGNIERLEEPLKWTDSKFCGGCGVEIIKIMYYCSNCGYKIPINTVR